MLIIKGERQIYTIGIFEQQNKKIEESMKCYHSFIHLIDLIVDIKLEDYCDQIEDDYVKVLPRIKKYIETL